MIIDLMTKKTISQLQKKRISKAKANTINNQSKSLCHKYAIHICDYPKAYYGDHPLCDSPTNICDWFFLCSKAHCVYYSTHRVNYKITQSTNFRPPPRWQKPRYKRKRLCDYSKISGHKWREFNESKSEKSVPRTSFSLQLGHNYASYSEINHIQN